MLFMVTTCLGMPFCMASPKKPDTSMLPNGDDGDPADEAPEPAVGVTGVQDPWLRYAACIPNWRDELVSSSEKWASESDRGRSGRAAEDVLMWADMAALPDLGSEASELDSVRSGLLLALRSRPVSPPVATAKVGSAGRDDSDEPPLNEVRGAVQNCVDERRCF